MEWSPQQAVALDKASTWYENRRRPNQVFFIAGYAGVGKTELLRALMALARPPVCVMAYTGKAASVIRRRTGLMATTIHSRIYIPRDKEPGRLDGLRCDLEVAIKAEVPNIQRISMLRGAIKKEESETDQPYFILNTESELSYCTLAGCDEVSMVGDDVGPDLLSFGVPLLILGDPAQLPPVSGGGFFTAREPDVMLTEIHRQAEGSPIIYLATRARNHIYTPNGDYDGCIVKSTLTTRDLIETDQVLVGRNRTRRELNKRIREQKGRSGSLPIEGDRLVCLRNNRKKGILNGTLWDVLGVTEQSERTITCSIRSLDDSNDVKEMRMFRCLFENGTPPAGQLWAADQFEFGNALTVHKFQGSQDRRITLIDESYCFGDHSWNHLYTGLTRAEELVTVVRG